MELVHSVTLDQKLCKGCTNCIKRCPTEAIRIRKGKAKIINERCIDCGECIRRCPYYAKKAKADSLDMLDEFTYKIALPAPSLYGQIANLTDVNLLLNGLLEIGFDHVFEVAIGAEQVSQYTRELIKENKLKKPIISSACPAIVRLIEMRFPELCDNVLPVASPMQVAAKMAKQEAILKKGLAKEKIGVFFISPCTAKITEAHIPLGIKQSWVNGAFSMAEIYPKLVDALNKRNIDNSKQLAKSNFEGIQWARSGGEAMALSSKRYLAADGMENVMSVLEELEDEKLKNLDYIELNVCPGGCVGGVLTFENPYVAKARIGAISDASINCPAESYVLKESDLDWQLPLVANPAMKLSSDITKAMQIMAKIEKIEEQLPALDCGSCGAPRCRVLAEDIVLGNASLDDCIFFLRKTFDKNGAKNETE